METVLGDSERHLPRSRPVKALLGVHKVHSEADNVSLVARAAAGAAEAATIPELQKEFPDTSRAYTNMLEAYSCWRYQAVKVH